MDLQVDRISSNAVLTRGGSMSGTTTDKTLVWRDVTTSELSMLT